MKLFENISPMLLKEIDAPFDSEKYFFEVKLDGARTVAHLGKNRIYLQNKRFVDITPTYPELSAIKAQVNGECILDGELVVLDNIGRPDFNALQKRAHLKDSKKIKSLAQKLPTKFVAFDILYYKGKDLTDLPFSERRRILLDSVTPNAYIEVSQGIVANGTELFKLVRQNNMEGIVAKRLDSKYMLNKRTDLWVKIKNWKDEDFVIIGFTIQNNTPKDLLLAQYMDNKLILRSSIYFGFSKFDLKTILDYATKNHSLSPTYDRTLINVNAPVIWLKPKLVCTVEYMCLTQNLGLRQPIFKGIRQDSSPKSCLLPKIFYSKITT